MKLNNIYINNLWNGFTFIFLFKWVLVLSRPIYIIWFHINKFLVEILQQHVSPALGAIYGMLVLEGHTICKASWYTLYKYRKDPQVYGLNQWNETNYRHRPVLLLHGAVGSWSYLGDLANTLRNANIPVFVIDLGFGSPTEEIRQLIFNKIEDIRKLYSKFLETLDNTSSTNPKKNQSLDTIQEETSTIKLKRPTREEEISRTSTNLRRFNGIPLIDIVAHSNGGNVALYSMFTGDCSYIDEQGELKFRSELVVNPHIGKLITVALPSNQTEINWLREIDKFKDLFNVNAKYDALMAYKKCALTRFPLQIEYIDAAHIGIVFNREAHKRILQFLLK